MARLKDTQGMASDKGIFVPRQRGASILAHGSVLVPMQKLSVLSVFTEVSLHSHK